LLFVGASEGSEPIRRRFSLISPRSIFRSVFGGVIVGARASEDAD